MYTNVNGINQNMQANQNDGFELDWDSEVEATEFTLLPAGSYPFTVLSYERARHNASANLPACAQAILHIEVDGGQLGKRKIDHNLYLHSKTQGFLNEFFRSIGCTGEGNKVKMDWSKVPGARGVCEVFVDKYTKRNGQPGESNKIKKFVSTVQPLPGTIAATAPTAPQGWNPGAF